MSWINKGAAAPQNEGSIGNAPVMRYEVNPNYGLTEKHVQEYQSAGWGNVEVSSPVRTEKEIVYDNMFTYFNLIFAILSALLCMVGSFRNLTFLPIIIANILIGIFQEIRAKRVLEELTMLNAPHAFVVREGKISRVESKELVLDDIVVFRAGNQICADAVVVSGEIQVNESLLTGESDEITKGEGKQLMSGSFVVSGECRARLTAVGEASYISRLTLEAKTMQRGENSEMIRSLDKLVKFVGIILVPIGVLLFIQGFFMNHETLRDSITSMVAAIIGMIPEGLYLLASVALVVSAMRLGFMILYRICQPFNKVRVAVWTGCILGLLGCSIFFPDLFAITGMSEKCAMLFVVFSIATDSVFRFLTKTVKLIRKWCRKHLSNVDKEEIKNETEYSISIY